MRTGATITVDDFPANKRNCLTCETRRKAGCARNEPQFKGGYIFGLNKQVSGIIYCCPNYTGRYGHTEKEKQLNLF